MPIQPYSARHTSEDLGDRLRINIPSRKQWVLIVFMCVWLVGWAFGEITVLGSLFTAQGSLGPGLFMIVWLGGWTIGGAFALYIVAWQLFGQEVIEISNQALVTKRVVLGFGLPKEYSVEYIKDLRISKSVNANDLYGWSRAGRFYGLSGGQIAFDYGSKTVNFASGIDEAEAKQILAEIGQRFPQFRRE